MHTWRLALVTALLCVSSAQAALRDEAFLQDISINYELSPEIKGKALKKIAVDRDSIVYVLTSEGMARVHERTVARDRAYRPIADRKPLDIAVHDGALFWLLEDELFSARRAGKFLVSFPSNTFNRVAIASWDDALLLGEEGVHQLERPLFRNLQLKISEQATVTAGDGAYVVLDGGKAWLIGQGEVKPVAMSGNLAGQEISAAALAPEKLYLATKSQGVFVLDRAGKELSATGTRLPVLQITKLLPATNGFWAGTAHGVFWRGDNGEIRYYAGKRWLDNDEVIDLAREGPDLLVLTRTGLNRIAFRHMTLAEKARWYDEKIRKRHIRYGFCAELALRTPGDPASAEMIDTDNDGTWSNYYMASQAFRYAVTGNQEAKDHAWETFEALERLELINPLEGFPSRTFERRGFKVSDPERWHPAPDARWEWKAHTSSDEIIAHTFGCAVLYETAARTAEEKQRISRFITRVTDHIIRNDWYLIDVDGKPTLWGRWHPDYVNGYPLSIVDRRLNSAEIIALLQFVWHLTKKDVYHEKAMDLLHNHGYLENILSPMSRIAQTSGHVYQGHDMGNGWNHSDDLLAFDSYWVLWRYALDEQLKQQYADAIRDHWEIEKGEKNPLWNFVYGGIGAKDVDLEGALWTLRRFPLDTVAWDVRNSHRKDLTKLPPNFRRQEMAELLPPSERQMTRWNTQPFILDGGSGGRIEFAGDEYLLPYWMGRYLNLIPN